jgi:PGF-pre-PGF domain-containing protein
MKTIETPEVKNRIRFSYLISGLILVIFFVAAILPVSASGIEANREVSSGTAYAGGTFTVTVNISTDQYVEALTLDENLPDGWNVSVVDSDGATFQSTGTFKESTLEWIWVESLQAGEGKTVVYRVTVPSVIEPGNFTFSGNISAYSVSAVPVTGASEITATYSPPEADFSATPLSGTASLKVQFTDLSTGNPDSWEWDFDGNGVADSFEKNPVWIYETTGTYTVSLKATNATYGNDTETKTGYITVTEKTTSSGGSSGGSGGGGGGGGGGSPESSRNVALKEVSNEQIFKGIHTRYTFRGETNEIVAIEFDPKKNFGKTTTIVEMLKNTSSIVKEPAPGTVYKNLNIWVGNSGFSSSENLENASISFRVNRSWLSDNGIGENTITLYRYSNNTWNSLPTTLTGEDKDYFYFSSETPGFSPFAIAGPGKNSQMIITPSEDENNNLIGSGEKSLENEGNLSSEEEKENKSIPGSEILFAAAGLLASYAALKKRKIE